MLRDLKTHVFLVLLLLLLFLATQPSLTRVLAAVKHLPSRCYTVMDQSQSVQSADLFDLWPELAAGKFEVYDLPVCKVLLMDDANYPCWLVLVPRLNGLREMIDLTPELQQQVWAEVALASRAIQDLYKPFKLNIGQLGNVVSQLHIHVTGRLQTDPSWPGPCYGAVAPVALEKGVTETMVKALRGYFASHS